MVFIQPAIGQEAAGYISRGQLVPDDLVTRLVLNELDNIKDSDWLIDGFPRTVTQAKSLDQVSRINAVIDLFVPHEEIISRIAGRWIHAKSGRVYNTDYKPPIKAGFDDVTGEPLTQRPDDRPEVVKQRLIAYEKQTEPILHHYKQQNLVHRFTGKTSDEIYVSLNKFLKSFFWFQVDDC